MEQKVGKMFSNICNALSHQPSHWLCNIAFSHPHCLIITLKSTHILGNVNCFSFRHATHRQTHASPHPISTALRFRFTCGRKYRIENKDERERGQNDLQIVEIDKSLRHRHVWHFHHVRCVRMHATQRIGMAECGK